MSDSVRFRLEDLTLVLEAIRDVRPEFEARVKESGELTSKEAHEVFLRLTSLYAVLGSGAPAYLEALHVILQRTGNVERIRPNVDRRKGRKQVA